MTATTHSPFSSRARLACCVLPALLAMTSAPARADDAKPAGTRWAVILVGIPGDKEHAESFAKIADTWQTWLTETLDFPAEQVLRLPARGPSDAEAAPPITADAIRTTLVDVGDKLHPEDALWVFTLGHGSLDGKRSWFHVQGRDPSDEDFGRWLSEVRCREQVLWLTHAGSGWCIKPLSRPGRIVITATEAEAEWNETEFPEVLAEVASSPASPLDTDADGQVSIAELFAAVTKGVQERFQSDKRVPTEHAQLDDDGDGRGSEELTGEEPDDAPQAAGVTDRKAHDGDLARTTYLALRDSKGSTARDAARKAPAYRVLASDKGRVAIVDAQGKIEWETTTKADCHDLWLLENGNVLFLADRAKVVEMAPDKSVIWEYEARPVESNTKHVEVHAFQRLPGGVTMVAESGNGRIVEVDQGGRIVHEIALVLDHPDPHRDTRLARKLDNGHYLVCHEGDGKLREYDREGKVVWSYTLDLAGRPASPGHGPEGHGNSLYGAVRLENGYTLIAGGNNNRVLEVDRDGKTVWSLDQNELPGITLAWVTTLHALPGGDLVVGNCHAGKENPQLFQVTRDKQVVWKFLDFETFGNGLASAHVLGLPKGSKR